MKGLLFPCYCLFITLIIILADRGALPLAMLAGIPHYDWPAHLLLYGLFYTLLKETLAGRLERSGRSGRSGRSDQPCRSGSGRAAGTALLLTGLLLTAEEVSQLFFASRTFSFVDLGMGFLGIWLFRICGNMLRRRRQRLKSEGARPVCLRKARANAG